MLTGILDQVATDYYGISLSSDKLPDLPYESNSEGHHYRIRLNFDNRNYMTCKAIVNGSLELERKFNSGPTQKFNGRTEHLAPVTNYLLMQLFPFSLIFSSNLEIISVGLQLIRMFPHSKLVGKLLGDVARLRRPRSNLTWENVSYRIKYT